MKCILSFSRVTDMIPFLNLFKDKKKTTEIVRKYSMASLYEIKAM